MDETTDRCGRFVANVIVGQLDGNPSKPRLLMVRELETANHSTVNRLVLDALIFLWPGKSQEDIARQFVLFVTDAAPYMVKSAKTLKGSYPDLLHVTCLAHGLNRVAEQVRSKYKDVDTFLGNVKQIFKKCPYRIRQYQTALPNVGLPPEPVLTRWGTWLETVIFISTHFTAISGVINNFNEEDAVSIRRAQRMLQKESLGNQLAEITCSFSFLKDAITKFENRDMELVEAMDLIQTCRESLSEAPSLNAANMLDKLEAVLLKNPDISVLARSAEVLKGNYSVSSGLPPELVGKLKYCPVTSVEVERSFSMQKAMLSDRRTSFLLKNLEMHSVCHYEISVNGSQTE